MQVAFNFVGIGLIVFIIWWFWLSKPKSVAIRENRVDIQVANGVYTPARIEIPVGTSVTLRFFRKDASPCAEKVVFEAFGIVEDLPLDRPYEINLTADKVGEFEFTCQMKMYRGTLVVKNPQE